MLTYLLDIGGNIISIIRTLNVIDILDMFLLSFVVYQVMKFVRETRAEQLLKGILLLLIILLLIRQFNQNNQTQYNFRALGLLSDTFFNVGFMAIIVMFQPELRRVLERMGRTKMVQNLAFNLENSPTDIKTRIIYAIDEISSACVDMSATETGALIVLERETKLGEQIDTGTVINAIPSSSLIKNIFYKNTPLHDGAMIIRDGMIAAACCILPNIQKNEIISKDLGTRHRAAIGMSEISDALVIVVSEETGIISIAENGELTRGLNKERLSKYLKSKLLKEKNAPTADKDKKQKKKKLMKNGDKNE